MLAILQQVGAYVTCQYGASMRQVCLDSLRDILGDI
jgi:hypothetical protein